MIYFISSYPEKGFIHGEKTVGVASSTKNIILNLLKKDPQLKIKVFAEIFDKSEKYSEQSVEIDRSWKRNDLFSIVNTFSQVKPGSTLIVPIEFYMFGGVLEMIAALIMMSRLKLRNVKIVSIVHQVVENFDNLNESRMGSFFKKIFVKIYYFLIKLSSQKIVVFEEYFKKIIGGKNTIFIPHAVEDISIKNDFPSSDKTFDNRARLLYFGFISPYKGVEDLISKFANKDYELVLAGGKNPNHAKNFEYNRFCDKLQNLAEAKNVKITGFVDEKDIARYFKNSDIIILPYKNFFSSSGPLSLAFSFEKPFILSKPMTKYFDSSDFQFALKESFLTKEAFIFDFLDKNSKLDEKISEIYNNKTKILNFLKIIKQKRSWENVANQYYEIIK